MQPFGHSSSRSVTMERCAKVIDCIEFICNGADKFSMKDSLIPVGLNELLDGALPLAIQLSPTFSPLDRLRPLAFSAAFKLQDMIAEWVLRANGVSDWPFSKKLAAYDRLRATGYLVEPEFCGKRSMLTTAFWELYRYLVPFRSSVVHSGGVTLEMDGTVSIVKGPSLLHFTPTEQGAYMRAMCLIAKILSGQTHADSFLEHLIEADFVELQKYHQQAGLTVRNARIAAVVVHVPGSRVIASTPLTVEIDFDQLRRTMEKTYLVGAKGQLYFSVSVVVNDDVREVIWELPIEAVPHGVATLRQGDRHYDPFLHVTQKLPV